ncbi:MAG: succinate dehydrogenase, hydrophobic membrane anchor protein, partial [Endozoicomonas sp.]
MVTNITNLSRSGLYDWMLQRLTAIILGAYTLFLLGYIVTNPGLGYEQWATLFDQTWVRIFSLLTL